MKKTIRPLRGLWDWTRAHGGVYCEGPNDGPARERNKEFWAAGRDDGSACSTPICSTVTTSTGDAYENVHRFVMDSVINHAVGRVVSAFR